MSAQTLTLTFPLAIVLPPKEKPLGLCILVSHGVRAQTLHFTPLDERNMQRVINVLTRCLTKNDITYNVLNRSHPLSADSRYNIYIILELRGMKASSFMEWIKENADSVSVNYKRLSRVEF